MASYTITITSESTQTTVEVEDTDGSPRILAIVVKAVGESELHTLQLPPIDLDLLVRSLLPPVPFTKPTAVGGEPAQPAPAEQAQPEQAQATKAAKTPAPRKRTATMPVRKRAYRRMPDDLLAVYEQTGSVGAVAAHFDVPRHTAQGWIDRLRRAGSAA
jgi:hypothetical protein